MEEEPKTLCQLPEIGYSCAGCCVFNGYADPEDVAEQVRAQTERYRAFMAEDPTHDEMIDFFKHGKDFGLCYLVVFLDDDGVTMGCAAHPMQHDGLDYRQYIDGCDTDWFCLRAQRFNQKDNPGKAEELESIAEQFDGSVDFSLHMRQSMRYL